MTACKLPSCGSQAANKLTPTNDRALVPWTRCLCDSDFFLRVRSAWPPFPAIEPPGLPQPIDVTEGDRNLHLTFCDRMEYPAAWTVGIVVEELPQKGLVSFRHLSARTKCRTRAAHWVPLGDRPALILLKDQDGRFPQSSQCLFFRLMKSESWLNNCQSVSGVRYNEGNEPILSFIRRKPMSATVTHTEAAVCNFVEALRQ